jgi:hypothetical protein
MDTKLDQLAGPASIDAQAASSTVLDVSVALMDTFQQEVAISTERIASIALLMEHVTLAPPPTSSMEIFANLVIALLLSVRPVSAIVYALHAFMVIISQAMDPILVKHAVLY